ncbi:MAG: CRISPR-associated endonuclease Cas2 [Anaerolineae bacterium]|nr:CRISPR-associated endonuclease Cas2 [Anaerolineae bacterium]MDW8098624.1 CRISPR-associated endonuclease Cas2 [Anaerolineae bacterium]
MPCLVIYDIPDDRVRTKVAELCLDYGLDRIQYSAFVGQLGSLHRRELMARIQRKIGRRAAKVQLIYVAEEDWRQRIVIEQEEKGIQA